MHCLAFGGWPGRAPLRVRETLVLQKQIIQVKCSLNREKGPLKLAEVHSSGEGGGDWKERSRAECGDIVR